MVDDIRLMEPSISRLARSLLEEVNRAEDGMSIGDAWEDKALDFVMSDRDKKTRILQFVDVFPSLKKDSAILDHLRAYFPANDHRLPAALRAGLVIGGGLLTSGMIARAVRLIMGKMATRFVGGETAEEASDVVRRLTADGYQVSLDVLGEATLTESEADFNLKTLQSLMAHLSAGGAGTSRAAANFSVKLSSLTSFLDPVDAGEVSRRLLPRLRELFRSASNCGAFIHVDAEQFEGCDLSVDVLTALLAEPEFSAAPDAGIVIQAYLRDAEERLDKVLRWRNDRNRDITVRLVKGAYWDTEMIRARRMGWTPPVFLRKPETDACFERMAWRMMADKAPVRIAIASHNVRSIAAAICFAEEFRVPRDRLEFQFLYGMARATRKAVADRGYAVRVYTPFGRLVPGMAYLVRRILENGSNESFLRHRRIGTLPADDLIKNPHADAGTHGTDPVEKPRAIAADENHAAFRNIAVGEFHQETVRESLRSALDRQMGVPAEKIFPVISGQIRPVGNSQWISLNPSHPSRVVAEVDGASIDLAAEAAESARRAWPAWRSMPAVDRGRLLRRAAAIMEERRYELAALEICEAGKPWREADADVAEAIDYLKYYAALSERLAIGTRFQPYVSGEDNIGVFRPRGVAAVISPWNFPLAIPAGQVGAALATGNCVLFKPAEQTPLVAKRLFDILREAGVPPDVIHFLPGVGEEIGPPLVEHRDVDMIAFTGSRAVGEEILKRAAATQGRAGPKRVIAEMGGKNAVIVDSDADLDLAVGECLQAAFDYAGQKCSALSRLILFEDIHDEFLARFGAAARTYPIGYAETPGTRISPLIDADAVNRARKYFEIAAGEGRWALEPDESRLSTFKEGFFVPPCVIAVADRAARAAREEIFGPILCVLSAKNFDEAIEIANQSDYALTAGFFSRHRGRIERARKELDAGNIYINRSITGAVVGRQPFGGHKQSGIGSKAGGPDYLAQFCVPVTISENLSRHGFSPDI